MKCLNYVVNVDLNPCKNVKQMIPNDISKGECLSYSFGTV